MLILSDQSSINESFILLESTPSISTLNREIEAMIPQDLKSRLFDHAPNIPKEISNLQGMRMLPKLFIEMHRDAVIYNTTNKIALGSAIVVLPVVAVVGAGMTMYVGLGALAAGGAYTAWNYKKNSEFAQKAIDQIRVNAGGFEQTSADAVVANYPRKIAFAALKVLYHEHLQKSSRFSTLPKKIIDAVAALFVSLLLDMPPTKAKELFQDRGVRMLAAEKKKTLHATVDYLAILETEMLTDYKRIVDMPV